MVPAYKSVVPWVPAIKLGLFFLAQVSLVSGGMFSFYNFKIEKGKQIVGLGKVWGMVEGGGREVGMGRGAVLEF